MKLLIRIDLHWQRLRKYKLIEKCDWKNILWLLKNGIVVMNQTKILTNLNFSSFKEKVENKLEFSEEFYFYVVKSQYKTTRNGKRYILLNVINESGFFDLRLFDDKFDASSIHAKYIKAKIKSVFKNDFYNVNIDNLLIIKNDDLINQIKHISYKELLDLDKVNISNDIRVHNNNKILNISLN